MGFPRTLQEFQATFPDGESCWAMLHKLRSALGPRLEDRLRGLVEADGSYVGGAERGLRGGRMLVGKSLVAGAVEQGQHSAGRARLAVIKGLTFEHDLGLFGFVLRRAAQGEPWPYLRLVAERSR